MSAFIGDGKGSEETQETAILIDECASFVKAEFGLPIPLEVLRVLVKGVFIALHSKGFVIAKVEYRLEGMKL